MSDLQAILIIFALACVIGVAQAVTYQITKHILDKRRARKAPPRKWPLPTPEQFARIQKVAREAEGELADPTREKLAGYLGHWGFPLDWVLYDIDSGVIYKLGDPSPLMAATWRNRMRDRGIATLREERLVFAILRQDAFRHGAMSADNMRTDDFAEPIFGKLEEL